MTIQTINLANGMTVRVDEIKAVGPVLIYDGSNVPQQHLLNLFSNQQAAPGYKLYAYIHVYFAHTSVQVELSDIERLLTITDQDRQRHKNAGERKRDQLIKTIWP